jgi:hypothetical protein
MKKIILFVIIINLLTIKLLATNGNEQNSTKNNNIKDFNLSKDIVKPTHKTLVGIKKKIIDQVNYFTPDSLQISKETSTVNIKIYYDTLNQTSPSYSANVHIKLPEFYLTKIKTKPKKIKNKKTLENSIFNIKIRPIIKLRENRFLFLQNIIEYKKFYSTNEFGISNKINLYPIDNNYYEESIKFAYLKHLQQIYSITLEFSTNKDILPQKNYSLTFSISKLQKIYIKSLGYKIGGNTKENPVIYYHKLYFDFRRKLFNKKYLFLEITPYLLLSRDYHYKLEPAVYSSINIKF